jgi:DNA/RNA-binding domain of Phe-tRNA-synthetase-like protein
MGLKPSKYRSAAEALLRRFRREKNIPRLHPIVDLCNAVSIAFALPVAVFDLDNIDQYIKICHADGTERYLSFSGGIETPPQGEIIFKDASNNAHARRWTFRQSKLSAVQSSTTQALIISEGMHSTASKDVQKLIENLSQELSSLGVFIRGQTFLSARSPRFEFDI